MREVNVRLADPADSLAIKDLLDRLHPGEGARSTLPEVRLESFTHVAVIDGKISAVCLATLVNYGIEPYGMLEELVVDPPMRGRGLGRRLVLASVDRLLSRGAEVVFTSANDETTQAFYHGLGFRTARAPGCT